MQAVGLVWVLYCWGAKHAVQTGKAQRQVKLECMEEPKGRSKSWKSPKAETQKRKCKQRQAAPFFSFKNSSGRWSCPFGELLWLGQVDAILLEALGPVLPTDLAESQLVEPMAPHPKWALGSAAVDGQAWVELVGWAASWLWPWPGALEFLSLVCLAMVFLVWLLAAGMAAGSWTWWQWRSGTGLGREAAHTAKCHEHAPHAVTD